MKNDQNSYCSQFKYIFQKSLLIFHNKKLQYFTRKKSRDELAVVTLE